VESKDNVRFTSYCLIIGELAGQSSPIGIRQSCATRVKFEYGSGNKEYPQIELRSFWYSRGFSSISSSSVLSESEEARNIAVPAKSFLVPSPKLGLQQKR